MQFAWFIGDTLSQAALNFLNLVDGADSTLGTLGTEHSALHDLVRRIADETDTVPLTDRFFVQLELSSPPSSSASRRSQIRAWCARTCAS
ncbi:MAG: hypothetical protein R2810_09280 [Flavobacteriales bacterium]